MNLALHVTGRRGDGYHLLDSLVAFADVGDALTVALADRSSLTLTGPRAAGVPDGPSNLCLKAAAFFGAEAAIALDKHLPAEAGIGGGSSDAAAVLRALARLTGRAVPPGAEALGADVPVCLPARAARMRGIGEVVEPLGDWPAIPAVLVNPGVPVPTPRVFAALDRRDNPPIPDPMPVPANARDAVALLARLRNDLEPPAIAVAPAIADCLSALSARPGCALARMSGSGATCVGLFPEGGADEAAAAIAAAHPEWWVVPTVLR
ncbi:4-diphosphocytidyl-2C-methyl-D-erythritol kinase [Oceanicola sp. 22II-s10i]|nr:4-diphosphocytidyl-2C-methyl-D-erythritol kinase [Oceanicola sp. 22II-s10i]